MPLNVRLVRGFPVECPESLRQAFTSAYLCFYLLWVDVAVVVWLGLAGLVMARGWMGNGVGIWGLVDGISLLGSLSGTVIQTSARVNGTGSLDLAAVGIWRCDN